MLGPKELKQLYIKEDSNKQVWQTHWQDIADYCLPRKDDIQTKDTPGTKKHNLILDNTAITSLQLFAGALHGLLINPSEVWFELTTGDFELDSDDDVRFWFQDSQQRMITTLNNSNFQTEVNEFFLDLVGFGTSPLLMEEDEEDVIRFSARPIASGVIIEDFRGRVVGFIREYEASYRQILDQFGADALDPKFKEKGEKEPEGMHKIIHGSYPSDMGSMKPKTGLKFTSHYMLYSEEQDLEISGFNEFPWIVSRWSKLPGEKYGRSPGMAALPEAKMANQMALTTLKGAQKTVDPPVQMPHDGFLLPLNTKPGGINYYMSGTGQRDEIKPILNDARIDFGIQYIESVRQRIREAFFVDKLQLVQSDRMTAAEVFQRTEEQMRLLGPLIGRQQSEFLRPLVDRLFSIMNRRGLLLDPPESLLGRTVDVRYSSMIAKTQRISEGNSILRAFEAIAPFIQLDPSVGDIINGEETAKELVRIFGASQKMLRKQDEINATRQSRAEAQQQQNNLQQQQNEADINQKNAQALSQLQAVE